MPHCGNPGMNKQQGNKHLVAPIWFFEVTKEEKCQRKCKYTWQYVCNYNKAEYKYSRVWLSEKTNMHIKKRFMLNLTPSRLYRFNIKCFFI